MRLEAALVPHACLARVFLAETGGPTVEVTYTWPLSIWNRATSIQVDDWAAACSLLRPLRRTWASLLAVEIILPPGRYLNRERDLPATALAKLDDLLALEIERTTPVARHQVFSDYAVRPALAGASTVAVLHVLARPDHIEPLLSAMSQAGVRVTAVRPGGQDMLLRSIDLLKGSRHAARPGYSLLNRGLVALAAAAMLLSAGATGITYWRQSQALERLETDLEQAQRQALAARKRQSETKTLQTQVRQLRVRKSESLSVLQAWEEVTRLLPGTAWLTDLRKDDATLALDGYARSASELIGLLSRFPHFEAVEFASPVVRDPQRGAERFQIRLRLKPLTGPAVPSRMPQ